MRNGNRGAALHQVVECFLNFWVPQVFIGDSVLRPSGEKVKYFPVFSLLGSIAMLGDNDVQIATPDPIIDDDETANVLDEYISDKNVFTADDVRHLIRYIGHEESIGRGPMEFMIFKTIDSSIIESLVEVKQTVPTVRDLMINASPVWQLFSQLCRALKRNNGVTLAKFGVV